VPLEKLEMTQQEMDFFRVYKERFRRLTIREVTLLFLAERTGSVLLTGEHMVAEAARSLGLPVSSGTPETLDPFFPLSRDRSDNRAERTADRLAPFLSEANRQPTCGPKERCGGIRNVPDKQKDRSESVPYQKIEGPANLPYQDQDGTVCPDSIVRDLRARISPGATPSSWRVPGRDEPVQPVPANSPPAVDGPGSRSRVTQRNLHRK
jgi:hypothetical protein